APVPRRGGAVPAGAPGAGLGRPGPGVRHPRGRIGVHHARRGPGDAPRLPGVSAAVTAFGEISYASMAIVTLAYPRSAFPGPGLAALGWSGYLVPAVDGRAIKAVTFSSVKWPHLAQAAAPGTEPLEIVRCSVGRIGEEALLQRADEELATLAAAELAAATGVRGAPAAHRITRWGGALPQYT